MEIKQGDTVRIAENVPEIYTQTIFPVHILMDMEVVKVQDGNACIRPILSCTSGFSFEYVIPTKYLIKVGAEAKEPKFKYQVGQKVILHFYGGEVLTITEAFRDGGVWNKYKVNALPHHIWNENELDPYPTAPKIKVGDRVEELVSRKSGMVLGIDGDFVVVGIPYDKEKNYWHIDSVELVQPKEQTEIEETFDGQIRDVLNGEEHQDCGHPIQTAMINLDINDWVAYTADLAKEIVLKTVNTASDKCPEKVAEYAVKVAKAVVEGLKKK